MSGDMSLQEGYLARALSDLKSARVLHEAGAEDVANNVCFHCHQAVEKLLKAFLCGLSVAVPRTHDLNSLFALCLEQAPGFPDIREDCLELNDQNVEARYPDDFVFYTTSDAAQALERAERVWTAVSAKLP
jgi:HEPN domain-containing protein